MVNKSSSSRSAQTSKSQAMSSSAQRRRAIRSHTGCITCRARKVKCDEKPGICANCERLHLECQKADGTKIAPPASSRRLSDPPLGEVGIKRKRTFRSCAQCRASKARCSGQKPECSRCRQRQVDCVYDEDSTPQWERVVRSSRAGSSQLDASASESNSNNHPIIREEHDAIERPDQAATSDRSPLQTSRSMSIDRPILSITPLPGPSRTIPSRPSSVRGYTADEGPDSLEWLFKQQLPNRQRMRMLVKEFFENIHPLRCYAFIHRPSFIQHLDESSSDDHGRNALLHVVCALGAKFYALQYTSSLKPLSSRAILSAGKDWAKQALSLLFLEIGTISVQNLMTAVLLHDHELRVGNYASAFMLTGTITRMAQALQLNLEFSTDIFHDEANNGPSVCSKEARRRLMWSCYISDTLIGSGVDQLTLFHEPDLKIQLPCNERNFVLQVPCVTEMLTPGQFLPFVAPEQIPPRVIDNIGIVALYIRLIALRKQVLRYVKRIATSKPPWLLESEFAELDNALREWYAQLPPSLQFTRAALYTRRESSQLGAFVLLQCTYNWTTVDLYRIAMPKLYRLSPPWSCADDFRARLQETIFIHAQRCSTVLADASRHGIKTLADTWLPSIAFDGNRLMLYYITQIVGLRSEKGQRILTECMPYCRSNLQLLGSMKSMSAMAESLYPRAEEMLKKVSAIQAMFLASEKGDTSNSGSVVSSELIGRQTREATPDGMGPDYVLQPTSVYKMARDSIPIQEKHASEKSRPSRLRAHHMSSSAPTSPATSASFQQPRAPGFPGSSAFGDRTPENTPVLRQGQGLGIDPNAPHVHEFDGNFFSSGFDANWQPADVTSAAFDGNAIGLPSWLPAMTDVYTDLNFGSWPIGTDVMNGQPPGSQGPGLVGRNQPL